MAVQNINEKLVSDPNFAPFEGHYRKPVKTSVATGPTKAFVDLDALLGSLEADSQMRAKYKLKPRTIAQKAHPGTGPVGPQKRFPEENKNVSVPCWVCAVKYETGKSGDNDFHVILGDAKKPKKYMTAEVSGLPAGGPALATLRGARRQLVSLFPTTKLATKYYQPTPPIKVHVKGSLHFDGDHSAGKIGPKGMNPQTVWEIHPVTSIK